MERTYEAPSNEAPHTILGYHWGRSVTYLQFPFSQQWQAAKPRTAMSHFGFPPMLFSPFQNAAHGFFKLHGCIQIQLFDGVSFLLLVCMLDTFQIKNSNGFSIQVCPSCRFDKMVGTLRGIPVQGVTFDV